MAPMVSNVNHNPNIGKTKSMEYIYLHDSNSTVLHHFEEQVLIYINSRFSVVSYTEE